MAALRKIAEIQIDGEPLDLARNGEFSLVWQKGPDAYGRPVAERVALTSYFGVNAPGERRIQALIDLLGDALVRLGQQRDARLGRGGQREEE